MAEEAAAEGMRTAPMECQDCGCGWTETKPLDLEQGVTCPRCASANTGLLMSVRVYPTRDEVEEERKLNEDGPL
jgi:Zn finger protein HypA/HybF involved in hydrogenase expression